MPRRWIATLFLPAAAVFSACGTPSDISDGRDETAASRAGAEIAAELGIAHPAVIAHRGASWDAPESTRPAYELARKLGADYLEADLQRTADGRIVAFHDETLDRTTNVAEVFPDRAGDRIETFTYDELMRLDHGGWFNETYPDRARDSFEGLGVVTLEDLIDIAEAGDHTPGLYLETKSAPNHPGIEDDIVEILEAAGWMPGGDIIFQSFHILSVERLVDLAPRLPVVYLISWGMAAQHGFDHHLMLADGLGAAGVGPNGRLGSPANTAAAHERGLLVHHYTINEREEMEQLLDAGSDGIFTDRPDLGLEAYGRSGPLDPGAKLERLGY